MPASSAGITCEGCGEPMCECLTSHRLVEKVGPLVEEVVVGGGAGTDLVERLAAWLTEFEQEATELARAQAAPASIRAVVERLVAPGNGRWSCEPEASSTGDVAAAKRWISSGALGGAAVRLDDLLRRRDV